MSSNFLYFLSSHSETEFLDFLLTGYSFNLSTQGSQLIFKILISSLDIYNVVHNCDSLCCKTCDYQSCTCTQIRSTYSCTCKLPSTLMFAPIRESSSAYLNLFSKILSVTMLVPSASARVTAICGCISVGYPGYGSVFT